MSKKKSARQRRPSTTDSPHADLDNSGEPVGGSQELESRIPAYIGVLSVAICTFAY